MNACPTLVVGAGSSAAQVLRKLTALLSAFRSPVDSITGLALYENSAFVELHLPKANIPAQSNNTLLQWMAAIRAEENLERTRELGVQVSPPAGYSLIQLLLVVDSDQMDSALSIIQLAEEASRLLKETVPPRLHIVVVHPRVDELPKQLLKSLQAAIQTHSLSLCSTWSLSPARSDGSFLSHDDLVTTVAYLLFAALQPVDRNEQHWLFRRPHRHDDGEWMVLGCGLLVLPLPEVEEALVHRLWSDAYSEILDESEPPPDPPDQLQPDETSWWQRLIQAIPEVARAGANLTLSLLQEAPRVEGPPQEWLQQAEEWDAQWRKETLPRCEQAMQRATDEMVAVFRAGLQGYIQQNMLVCKALLPRLASVMDRVFALLQHWTASKVQLEESSSESVQAARTLFEQSLQRLPQKGRLITVSALLILLSWAVLQGVLWLLAPRLGDYVWWATATAALLPPLVIGLVAFAFYQRRKKRLLWHWHQFISEIRAQHTHLLRQSAIQVLQGALEQMQQALAQETEQLQQLQQELHARIDLSRYLADSLRLVLPPPLRSVVSTWKHLQPIAQELWGNRPLAKVVRRGMEETGITSLRDLYNRLEDLSRYLRHQLLHHWMGPEHRQMVYYLQKRFEDEETMQRWLHEEMEKASQEACALLWRCEKPADEGWRLIVQGLPVVNGATVRTPSGDEIVVVPNILGRVCSGIAGLD